ncbi:GNAT family N-acetyltransferase [Streptomyces sp. J2-1]|uniref:GNAT family N-acetyltransferase n=1 Tax=Streptomyces corallincola TaxID=2851888 RepID=UPI001C37E975|nr:GNAT family N-acetyltransferase [Streptomyces corallincola]MBV2356564.1 GNAT family N-acetyltransferase [Streptomyces corallincola]
MTVIVRELRPDVPEDLAGYARVRRHALPFLLCTPESVRHLVAGSPPGAALRLFLATEEGAVTGVATASLAHDSTEPGQAHLNVYVRPDRTGRGAGGLLVRTAEEYLGSVGATRCYSYVLDAPGNAEFAARRGYRPGRPGHFLRLDLTGTALPEPPPVPAGMELRTAASFAADPRPLFALDAETTRDEPGEIAVELADYPAWLATSWENPLLDRELTLVVVADGRPVAFTVAHTDGSGHYASGMTGTARAHRGLGLARLAKTHSLHRARAAGLTTAFTGNDASNTPMLTINKRLGYEICATEIHHVRELP